MKQILKNSAQIICYFLIGAFIALLIPDSSTPLLLDNEFLITFSGVVLGISATIVTFIFSSTDKVKSIIASIYDTPDKVSAQFESFKKGYAELVQDNNFIFRIFIVFLLLAVFSVIDIPYVSMPTTLPKQLVLNMSKMGLFVNCLVATADLFFSLSNILKLVMYERA